MNILSIGGSDPSSGAGIQADIRTAAALGAHCFCALTAVTAQNSTGFYGVEPVPPKMIRAQIDSVFSDFDIDVVNIAMVYDSKTISVISKAIKGVKIPVVLDPVVRSTTGGTLLQKTALPSLRRHLLPLAGVVTPNIYEAEIISGTRIKGVESLRNAAEIITEYGAAGTVITGCEFEKDKVSDFVYTDNKYHILSSKKITGDNHGSGGNFSVALAYSIARGDALVDAARFAKEFTYKSIMSSRQLGRGIKITYPRRDSVLAELTSAIRNFQDLENVALLIPEVQSNFVFAKPAARTIGEVAGVAGRIVRAGSRAVVAGAVEYGGSRHVATAVLAVKSRFPKIRAAINIRYDENTIKKLRRANYKVLSYDRSEEPQRTKRAENSTVHWGISDAIKGLSAPPDAVYHRGDVGKEPMIIVFGVNPEDVLGKIRNLST